MEHGELIDNEWYNTGDRVEREGDYIKIVGRETDFINVGGEKVDPMKVEDVLIDMPSINDISVYGVKNDILGEVVGCTIWTNEPIPKVLAKHMIRRFSKGYLKPHEIPVQVEVVQESLTSRRGKKIRHDNISAVNP